MSEAFRENKAIRIDASTVEHQHLPYGAWTRPKWKFNTDTTILALHTSEASTTNLESIGDPVCEEQACAPPPNPKTHTSWALWSVFGPKWESGAIFRPSLPDAAWKLVLPIHLNLYWSTAFMTPTYQIFSRRLTSGGGSEQVKQVG
jgi:hypothetical protein